MWDTGRLREALDRMDAALELLAAEEPDADVAALAAQVGRFKFFAGEPEVALERIETALDLAESLGLPEVLSQAVNTKAMILSNHGRVGEAGALVRYALEVALEHDIPSAALRALQQRRRPRGALRPLRAGGGRLPRRARARPPRRQPPAGVDVRRRRRIRCTRSAAGTRRSREAAEVPEDVFSQTRFPFVCFLGNSVAIHCHRGELEAAAELIEPLRRAARLRRSDRAGELRLARGAAPAGAPAGTAEALAARDVRVGGCATRPGGSSESMKEAFPIAVEAALAGRRHGARRRAARRASRRWGTAWCRSRCARRRCGSARGWRRRAGDGERADRLFRGAAGAPARAGHPVPDGGRHARARRVAGGERPAAADAETVAGRGRGRCSSGCAAAPWLERADRVAAPAGDQVAQLRPAAVGTGRRRPGGPATQPLGGASAPGEPRPSLSATARSRPTPRALRRRGGNVTVW